MIHFISSRIGRLFAAAMLMIAAVFNAHGAAVPPAPGSPIPAAAATGVPANAVLRWNTDDTTPTLTPVSNPKVLVLAAKCSSTIINNAMDAVRAHFTTFSSVNLYSYDAATVTAQLADKQVFLIPAQESWTYPAMADYGTTIGAALRQFVMAGGLVVACDHSPYGATAQFLSNAGLMDVSYSGLVSNRTAKVVSSNPIAADLSTTFTARSGAVSYNSVGDAEILVADAATNKPIAAIKKIGAGHVLLLGWCYNSYNSDMGHILANAIESLSLSPGVDILGYDVYFGTSTPPLTKVASATYANQYAPSGLHYDTNYYWQVIAQNPAGTTAGPIWSFQTGSLPAPDAPSAPNPADGSNLFVNKPILSWNPGITPATYSVYLDKSNPPTTLAVSGLTEARYTSATLDSSATYYWRVVSHNATDDTNGPVWSFTTPAAPAAATTPAPADGATSMALNTKLSWNCSSSPVQILVFNGHADMTAYSQYDRAVGSFATYYPNCVLTTTVTEDPAALAAELVGKQVFLLPAQANWTSDLLDLFGTRVGPVLRKFTEAGGTVIVCDWYNLRPSNFVTKAGLMNIQGSGYIYNGSTGNVAVSNQLTAGLGSSITLDTSVGYIGFGDAQMLIRYSTSEGAIALFKQVGAGSVLLMGSPIQRMLANAAAYAGGTGFDVYFGATNPPATKLADGIFANEFSPGALGYETTYYWRVVSRSLAGTTTGPVWSFRTPDLPLPAVPSQPMPPDGSAINFTTTTLSWAKGPYPVDSFNIKLSTTNPPTTEVAVGLTTTTCALGTLNAGATYYWQVTATNAKGSTAGPVWSFSTPPPPPMPFSPAPADGATSVPLNTLLQWNASPNPVEILAYIRFSDNSATGEYRNTIAAIREHCPDIHVTTTTTQTPSELAALLAGKHVFLMPEQENGTSSDMQTFGLNNRYVLQSFVRDGGMVACCDYLPIAGTETFLHYAGLGYISTNYRQLNSSVIKIGTHPILQGVAPSFTMPYGAVLFYNLGTAEVLVKHASYSYPIAGISSAGAGSVLVLGWDYSSYNSDMGRLLANAVQYAGGTTYDVFFGTTNPPTTKLASGSFVTQCSPGTLQYATTYYWRVVSRGRGGETSGPVWSFRTPDMPLPVAPSNPSPQNGASNVSTTTSLSWTAGAIPATFSVKLGTTNPPSTQIATGMTEPTYTPARLNPSTTYYWQVTSTNTAGSTPGPVWSFSTPALPVVASPLPAHEATGVAIDTKLQWNTNLTSGPVQVLAYWKWADKSAGYGYEHTIAALKSRIPDCRITTTTATDATTLAADLAGKRVFLVPEQYYATATTLGDFGTSVGAALQSFVQSGGAVIACDAYPTGGMGSFLQHAGLMNVTTYTSGGVRPVSVVASNTLTAGVPATFSALYNVATYSSVGDAEVLVKETSSNRPVVASKSIGTGMVLLIGWNYYYYNDAMARLLGNAVQAGGAGGGFESYDVYFGTTNPPTTKLASGIFIPECPPGTLQYGTTYFWRVVGHNSGGDTTGPVWSFRTMTLPAPAVPSKPLPVDGATCVSTTTTLYWTPGSIPATFSVKFGTSNPPTQIATGLTEAKVSPGQLTQNTKYYWQVTSSNATGTTAGPVWSFTTTGPPLAPLNPMPANSATSVSLNTSLSWNPGSSLAMSTVQILAFTGHSSSTQYSHTIAALQARFTNFTVTTTTSEDPDVLLGQLYGKQVFLLPEQSNSWVESNLADFGNKIGPVVKQFAETGGMVIVCDGAPENGMPAFLAKAGLMDVTKYELINSRTVYPAVSNAFTAGVSSSFTAQQVSWSYTINDDSQMLVRDAYGRAVVARRPIGAGSVVLLGFNFYSYNTDMARMLSNAVITLGVPNSASENYDCYFGTTNPPTTILASGTRSTTLSPGTLQYATTYYWRIVAHNTYGDTAGPVWSFRTANPPMPIAPYNPVPLNLSKSVPTTATLSWSAGTVPATFSVKLDTKYPPTAVAASGLTQPTFTPAALNASTRYYWQVTATNVTGTTTSAIWNFTTAGPPPSPFNPNPANGATSISLSTMLSWNNAPTLASVEPVQILTFAGHSDNSSGGEYNHTLAALKSQFTNCVITSTTTEIPATLAMQLKGKQVLLVPEQENWTGTGGGTFGTNMAPVLQQFVQGGGLVIVCELDGNAGSELLRNAGLMTVTKAFTFSYYTLSVVTNNAITMGVSSFTSQTGTGCYSSVGDAQVLIKRNSGNEPVVAYKQIGLGGVLLMGWDYYYYDSNQGRLLANAIRYASGVSSVELYDVYIGTTNPPTTKLVENTHLTECSPGALAYDTTYYWRVVAHNHVGDTMGPVWSFRTGKMPVPEVPRNPSPEDQSPWTALTPALTWSAGSIPATFSVKLDTKNPPTAQIATGLTSPYAACSPLAPGTTYYWQVTATNGTGTTAGPVWRFKTEGAPDAPLNPSPADGATSVSINTMLRWTGSTIPATALEPVRILAFTGHCDTGSGHEYQNTIAALREHFTNFVVTETKSEDPNVLLAQLADKHVFLMPEQALWSADNMATFGTTVKSTLQQFVSVGGWVICCDNTPWWGATRLLKSAGLMTMYNSYSYQPSTVKVAVVNSVTQTLPRVFTITDYCVWYQTTGDAEPLVTLNVDTKPRPVAAQKRLESGNTVLFGWDYATYRPEQALMLANAVRAAGTSTGICTYDVYFDTTNPPATKVLDRGVYAEFTPAALKYETTYYWKVVAHNNMGDAAGPVWSFRTGNYPKPEPPSNPKPVNGERWASTSSTLSWSAGAYPGTYSIKLDTKNPPVRQITTGLAQKYFSPTGMKTGATYYWQVTATNLSGSTASPVWSFKTPAKPPVPTNPGPPDGQCLVTLKTPLSWDVFGRSVQVLEFNGHTDNYYYDVQNAIKSSFTQVAFTATTVEDANTLNARLADKQIFLIPEQRASTKEAMGTFGTNVGYSLKSFVAKGGVLIVCDGLPYGGASNFLTKTGLMNVTTYASNVRYDSASVAVSNQVTQGLASTFQPFCMSVYNTISDAQVLVKQTSSGNPVVAMKKYGAGTVLLVGMRYMNGSTDTNSARLLANAVKSLGEMPSGIESYDVYFGTTNPPKTKIYSGIYTLPTAPPAMDFQKTYFWQVIAHNALGDTAGPVWMFTTGYKSAVPGHDWSCYE